MSAIKCWNSLVSLILRFDFGYESAVSWYLLCHIHHIYRLPPPEEVLLVSSTVNVPSLRRGAGALCALKRAVDAGSWDLRWVDEHGN